MRWTTTNRCRWNVGRNAIQFLERVRPSLFAHLGVGHLGRSDLKYWARIQARARVRRGAAQSSDIGLHAGFSGVTGARVSGVANNVSIWASSGAVVLVAWCSPLRLREAPNLGSLAVCAASQFTFKMWIVGA